MSLLGSSSAPAPDPRRDEVAYRSGEMRYRAHRHREPEERLADYLEEARRLLAGDMISLQMAGGPQGSRTPDLRRAKAST